MTRVEMLRAARGVAQVAFAEYLKIRASGAPILVFEGRQCPSFYIGKVVSILGTDSVKQIIARGKRNVLELRDLIKRNLSTAKDVVVYFVDKDFDAAPTPGEFPDVYVTRGYSIENEYLKWGAVECFIRANFDIADASDEQALSELREFFELSLESYLRASTELHKTVYLCRTESIRCLPGDEITAFLRVDWMAQSVSAVYTSYDALFDLLSIGEADRSSITQKLPLPSQFEALEPVMDWRGKYHFHFLKLLLSHIAAARVKGARPFARGAKISVDPSHPSLLSSLSAHVGTPPCLVSFLRGSPLAPQL
jgi:hypothetical protein